MPDITYDVGRVSFVMKGAWNLATAYEKLDAVTYDGSLYIAKQDVPGGTAITNTTYWQLAAEKGDQGETGNGIASIAKTGTAGNVDTYTITYTDGTTTTFTVTNGGVTTVNGRTGDVTGLAEEDGSYPLLNAGTADNLTPYSEDSGATQDIPFIAQGTGCGNGESVVDTGSYLQFKKKLGNTVAVNQLAKFEAADIPSDRYGLDFSYTDGTSYKINGTSTQGGNASGWFNLSEVGGLAGKKGHMVLCVPRLISGTITGTAQHGIAGVAAYPFLSAFVAELVEVGGQIRYSIEWGLGTVFDNAVITFEFHDIDQWFGSRANIPSDLLSHPENWGRYYAGSLDYAAGYLDSADGTVMRSIGRNCFDGELESGSYNPSTGAKITNANAVRSKNLIPCIPNETYYFRSATALPAQVFYVVFFDAQGNFVSANINGYYNATKTIPANAHFMGFWTGSASYPVTDTSRKFTLSIYYSGESGYDSDYPYSVLAEVDTGSEVLRGVEGSRDEKLPNGTIIRRRKIIDLGALNYQSGTPGLFFSDPLADTPEFNVATTDPKVINPKYIYSSSAYGNVTKDKVFCINVGRIWIVDTAYSDVATFKAAMSGVMFEYPLATPTTEQGTAFAENIPCDDFGSMYWTQTKGIPQGNEIFYPVDYKASIDTLYNRVEGDMSKIVTEDEYPEAPSSDGTYVLKATVSGGTKTYAWVAE